MIWGLHDEGVHFRIERAKSKRTWVILATRVGCGQWATLHFEETHAECVAWLRGRGW